MNFRNRKLVLTVQTLLGILFVFSGVMGLIGGPNAEGVPASMVPVLQTLWQTGIFQMIKVTETVAGLMLLVNFLPALAAIFIAPIAVGIIIVNSLIAPAYLPMGFVVVLLNAYLGYAYWSKYKALFSR